MKTITTYFLLFLLSLQPVFADLTFRTVKTTGGDYAGTLAGLQSAVNDAAASSSTDPWVIEVEAGVTYSNPTTCYLELKSQTVKKLIFIRSSRLRELPENVRVVPADAAKLFKIENDCAGYDGTSQAVIMAPPEITGTLGSAIVSHYVIQGAELYYSGNNRNSGGAMNIGYHGDTTIKARQLWQAPHTIMLDRSWTHGRDSEAWVLESNQHATQNGVRVDGRNITIKNSRLSDNNMDTTDHGQGESRGIAGSNAPGPLYVYNNYIDGAIGSILGGEAPWISGLVFAGGWFYGNEYTRNPAIWHWEKWDTTDTLDTTKPCISNSFWQQKVAPSNKWKCVAGSWTPSVETRTNRGWVKNAWECKSCILVNVEGNYIHDIPSTDDQQQKGYAFLFNHVDAFFGALFSRPEHIQVRNNKAFRVGQGPTLSWGGSSSAYYRTNNITIEHNIFREVFSYEVSPKQGAHGSVGGGTVIQVSGLSEGLKFDRNTFSTSRDSSYTIGLMVGEDPPNMANSQMTNNIFYWGTWAQSPLNLRVEDCTNFRNTFGGNVKWDNNGIVDGTGAYPTRGQPAFDALFGAANCPTTMVRAVDYASAGFANAATGDFRVCKGNNDPVGSGCTTASGFATAATDGGVLGADAAQVDIMTAGAAAGTFSQDIFEVQIRTANKSTIRYTSFGVGGTCSGTIKNIGGTTVDSWTDTASVGVTNDRSHTPSLASVGEYTVRISCANAGATQTIWRDKLFKKYN